MAWAAKVMGVIWSEREEGVGWRTRVVWRSQAEHVLALEPSRTPSIPVILQYAQ